MSSECLRPKELTLDQIQFMQTSLHREEESEMLMARATHTREWSLMHMAYLHSMKTWLLGLPDHTIDINRHIPKTWWDAFKMRWFPKWMLRRWPAHQEHIYHRERIYKAICPHLKPALRGNDKECLSWLADQEDK